MEPIGEYRHDVRSASIVQAIAAVNGVKKTIGECMVRFQPETLMSYEDGSAMLASYVNGERTD